MRGGTYIEVTAQNVHEYVRRYAEHRMVKVPDKALKVSVDLYVVYMKKFYSCAR